MPFRDSEGLAVALYNMAVCLITLNDFPRALATYQRAREMCVQHGMTLLVTQADYNIAYLYYLRGEYGRAIEMLRATRERVRAKRRRAHPRSLLPRPVGHLSGAEPQLGGSRRRARRIGALSKARHGLRRGEVPGQRSHGAQPAWQDRSCTGTFRSQARAKFVHEKNLVWPWLIDLYRRSFCTTKADTLNPAALLRAAIKFFDTSYLPNKAVLCHLLLARLPSFGRHRGRQSRMHPRAAGPLLARSACSSFQAEFLSGQIAEASGSLRKAYDCFQRAREALETLRSGLHGEELKIAFMKNRLEVYECLVEICMQRLQRQIPPEESFGYMEWPNRAAWPNSSFITRTLRRRRPGARVASSAESVKCARN